MHLTSLNLSFFDDAYVLPHDQALIKQDNDKLEKNENCICTKGN